ncbi:WD40 repeat-like protein [Cristinia sonorae]|uniref:WD40 repeat-like protein n=1 Tax=Cristinia sonorae TaxID=1940300 RepID=A0A8K0XUH9_9AGAR|nr:WD40 repeat-like protein [Cristinia sonorae]
MNNQQRPSLYLAPSVNTTTVVTTTTTTTTYAPIQLPPLPTPSSPKDAKTYPLYHAHLPKSLRRFPLVFPGGSHATFRDGDTGEEEMQEEEEVSSGVGWRQIKRDADADTRQEVGLAEAIERYGRKRSYSAEHMMEGIEPTPGISAFTPPRKKAKAAPLQPISTASNPAAPPSPLPSPHGSPPPENIWPSAPPSGNSSPQPQAPFQPDLSLTTLLTLPSLLAHFSNLPPQLQSHVLLTFLRHSPLNVLRTLHSVLTPTLARDFLTLLPAELVSLVLSYLSFSDLTRASRVSKSWRAIIDSDPVLWRDLLKSTKIWYGGQTENAFADAIYARRKRKGLPPPGSLPLPHPYKILFQSRHLTCTRWVHNQNPRRITFPAHGHSVVTCLIFSHGRIISASDDHSIHVYSPHTGQLMRSLDGHEGGVWALAATKNTLVSGSTDRTVRIWDLTTGRCTHVFGGHTSTVRCLAIVKPEMIDVEENGIIRREKWPKRPLIVTGSRDHSLRVWALPRPGDDEYRCYGADDTEVDPSEEEVDDNPYHKLHLEGHEHAVRALAARGRTLVSGSYDCYVRIWDIVTGNCKWTLGGHTQKVYSVVLDIHRNLACSGSMDGTVRVWNLSNGQCQHTLTGHTSLVGLLGLSSSFLVSAAADSTLRVWDPESGELRHTLAAHNGAITCFQHDEFKVLSGSDGTLKMWDIRDGTQVRDLLTGIAGVWQIVFEGRWCVAASNRGGATVLDVWDFGNEEGDEEWEGEPAGGLYDESSDDNDEDPDDVMDQDPDAVPSDTEDQDDDEEDKFIGYSARVPDPEKARAVASSHMTTSPQADRLARPFRFGAGPARTAAGPSAPRARVLPNTDETPTRPRIRSTGHRRR